MTALVDLLHSEAKCMAHAGPVFAALPEQVAGAVIDRSKARPALRSRMRERVALVASLNDARAASRRGYGGLALIEHGIGQSYEGLVSGAYPGGRGRDIVGLFLSPNETAAARDRAAYPSARVAVVGCPRLDTLPAREAGDGPVVAISWHWDGSRPPELRSAWRHHRGALARLRDRFRLIGHAHPMAVRHVLPEYRRLGIEWVESFDEVCRRADVYVADNSSTLYEFASTGRPVVVLGAPWYRREVEHGLRFWAAAGVGVGCDEPSDLVGAIEEALADPPERKTAREAALRVVYAYRKGAAKRAAKAITEWLA